MNVKGLQSGKYNSHWLSKLDFITVKYFLQVEKIRYLSLF